MKTVGVWDRFLLMIYMDSGDLRGFKGDLYES